MARNKISGIRLLFALERLLGDVITIMKGPKALARRLERRAADREAREVNGEDVSGKGGCYGLPFHGYLGCSDRIVSLYCYIPLAKVRYAWLMPPGVTG